MNARCRLAFLPLLLLMALAGCKIDATNPITPVASAQPDTALYGLVIAGIWQGSGVTMAILLAGLRGVDAEIWKAARVDGIPAWRTQLFIVLPMMGGSVATAFVLQCVSVVRVYDLIVAMTGGGPGISTSMPAVYVIEMITSSQNVGQGMAAATIMLLPILAVLIFGAFLGWRRKPSGRAAT